MNNFRKNIFYCIVSTFIFFSTPIYSSEKPVIFVSIDPQKYIVDQITANEADVHVLLGSNQNPHSFAPTPNQITKLCTADVLFITGIPFEKNIIKKLKSLNKNILIVDSSAGIKKIDITSHSHHKNHHSHKHEPEPDPHVWLSIPMLVKQIETITETLIKVSPKKSDYFRSNSDNLISEFSGLHKLIKKSLAPYKGRAFYIYHPSLGYFADEYGLVQRAVESGGKKPTSKQIAKLALQISSDKVNIIFAQPQFDQTYVKAVAKSVGCEVEIINPLEYNILKNMNDIVDKLKKSFNKTDK